MINSRQFIEIADETISQEGADAAACRLRDRLPALLGAPDDANAVLDKLRVLIVGSGAIGRGVALDLARLGIGAVGICDPKKYKPQSIETQPIRPAEMSGWKGELTARACREISSHTNPSMRVCYYNGPLQGLALAELADFDIVVMTTDNLAAEVETGQRCLNLGIPLLNAAVHGDTLVAQVRFFANRDSSSPCPACNFGATERAQLNAEVAFSCERISSDNAIPEISSQPTVSISSLCALAGNLAMMQLVRHVLGLGEPVGDTLLDYTAYTHRTVVSKLTKNENCVCNHTRYARALAPRPLADCSLVELISRAGLPPKAGEPLSITVDDRSFAESGVCDCGYAGPIGRLVGPNEKRAGRCPECGKALHCERFFLHRPVSTQLLGSALTLPLRETGAGEPEWALIQNSEKALLFQNPA